MKRIAFILLVFFLAQSAHSQITRGSSVPPNFIQQQFQRNFPDAEEVRWNSPRYGFSASFFQRGYAMTAFFSEEGDWMSTRISIPESQVPSDAMRHYRDNYPGFRITETVFHDATGDSYYCIFVIGRSSERELHYDDNGNFIRAVNK
ncbi:MAG: PepSY-like domain-containing protein [Bacteroidia bacterium]|nr:PepSY-like domain-containing protein [Bacteroidia bacterium]